MADTVSRGFARCGRCKGVQATIAIRDERGGYGGYRPDPERPHNRRCGCVCVPEGCAHVMPYDGRPGVEVPREAPKEAQPMLPGVSRD